MTRRAAAVTRAAVRMSGSRPGAQLERGFAALRELGLEVCAAELGKLGYTVIPPDTAGTRDISPRLLDRITELSAEARGCSPDFTAGRSHADSVDGIERLDFLLAKGRVFEEALMHPVVLALVDYLLGSDAVLSSILARIKGPGKLPLMLHSDQSVHPAPLPQTCNVSFALTDYTRENGGLCMLPGSHQLLRNPLPAENFGLGGLDRAEAEVAVAAGEDITVEDPPGVVPIEAEAGSIVAWSGNTWHGAFNRSAPGLRVNLILFFCNQWLRPQEAYRELLPAEVLARNDKRFARLVGSQVFYGWGPEGASFDAAEAFDTARQRAGTAAPAIQPEGNRHG